MIKIKRGALILFVLLSSILLCTSCLSFLLADGNGPEKATVVFAFAPDASNSRNAKMPSVFSSNVSVTVESQDNEILAEDFFKAGSRESIRMRVPRDEFLKITVEFSGPGGVWTGSTNRTLTDSYSTVIVKMKKIAGGVAIVEDIEPDEIESDDDVEPDEIVKPTDTIDPVRPVDTVRPRKPIDLKPVKPVLPKPQVAKNHNLRPIYFSAINSYQYRFKYAENDLKTAKFDFVNDEERSRRPCFCRDNYSHLYVKSFDKLQRYNEKGELKASVELPGPSSLIGAVDIACDPTSNGIYTVGSFISEIGNGVQYTGIYKIENSLKTKRIAYFTNNTIYGDYKFIAAFNGMIIISNGNLFPGAQLCSIDTTASSPKASQVKYGQTYGADVPFDQVKDIFMDDKYIYYIYEDEMDFPLGGLILYKYKITGSNGNRKIKITGIVGEYGAASNRELGSTRQPSKSYYNKHFYNPVKFIGYRNGYLYIADDGFERKLVDSRRLEYKNTANVNRVGLFNISYKRVSFQPALSAKWCVEFKKPLNTGSASHINSNQGNSGSAVSNAKPNKPIGTVSGSHINVKPSKPVHNPALTKPKAPGKLVTSSIHFPYKPGVMYFSASKTVSNNKYIYQFHNAKNNLKRGMFFKEYKKQIPIFCLDIHNNLYVVPSSRQLMLYNKDGKRIRHVTNIPKIEDIAFDRPANKAYALSKIGSSSYRLLSCSYKLRCEKILDGYKKQLALYNNIAVSCDDNLNFVYTDLKANNKTVNKLQPANGGVVALLAMYKPRDVVVNDVFMTIKDIYAIVSYKSKPGKGALVKFGYRAKGNIGSRKIEITSLKLFGYDPKSKLGNSFKYYTNNFSNPIKFVGYDHDHLYIADDGYFTKKLGKGFAKKYDYNRLAIFDLNTSKLKFETIPKETKWTTESGF